MSYIYSSYHIIHRLSTASPTPFQLQHHGLFQQGLRIHLQPLLPAHVRRQPLLLCLRLRLLRRLPCRQAELPLLRVRRLREAQRGHRAAPQLLGEVRHRAAPQAAPAVALRGRRQGAAAPAAGAAHAAAVALRQALKLFGGLGTRVVKERKIEATESNASPAAWEAANFSSCSCSARPLAACHDDIEIISNSNKKIVLRFS